MPKCGRSSRLSFEVKQPRGGVNKKELDMTTDIKEMKRLRRLQKVTERRLTQVSPAEMIGRADRHVWGFWDWFLHQFSQIDIIESL